MGLDNIPATYPCKKEGTAVLDSEQRIDCALTQEANGCPWKRDSPKEGRVLGIMGTDCWYRGKVGTWMIDELTSAGFSSPPVDFYGNEEQEPNLTPEDARLLHKWLQDHGEAYAALGTSDEDRRERTQRYAYATWWVGWCAEKAEGINAW